MGDWRLRLYLTLITGMSSSGKSTFAFRYLLNTPAAAYFVFDDQGRDARRMEGWNMGIEPCHTVNELENALARRWVVFQPNRMFPDDLECKRSFDWFCQWVYDVSCRAPGKKFLLVNDVWRYQDRDKIPPHLSKIILAGREENIHPVLCTSMPQEINAAITVQSTELVCFKIGEGVQGERLDPALAKIQQLGVSADLVRALPMGSFIALNRITGEKMTGKVF